MKGSLIIATSLIAFCQATALAHRVDEYLQAATLLVSAGRLQLELRLAPGIEVAQKVLDGIDLDRNGVLSAAEQRSYALRVLRDLDVSLDEKPVVLALDSVRFDEIAALRDGRGEIKLAFKGDLPTGRERRRLVFENRHRPDISVYLVNSLVPDDLRIRIAKQQRNYLQSTYELQYVQQPHTAADSRDGVFAFWMLAIIGLIVAAGDELRRRVGRTRSASQP